MSSAESEALLLQESVTKVSRNLSRKTDPAWGHCTRFVDEDGETVLFCLYCIKLFQ